MNKRGGKMNKKDNTLNIVKTHKTNYYEFDWYVPYTTDDKVYLAIKGIIDNHSKLPLRTCGGSGYEWEEDKKYKMRTISKEKFLEKANEHNIVYFFEDINNCNDLLNYPLKFQKIVDRKLYYCGFKTHGTLSIFEKRKISKEKQEVSKKFKDMER